MKKITAYKSNDGTLFENINECIKHDNVWLCPECKGIGTRTILVNTYPEGLPDSGWVERLEQQETHCNRCFGDGFLNNMPKELDPEYEQYKKLKEKFKE